MDYITGDIGGKFRLATYFIGENTHYITGGTIAENLFDIQDKMLIFDQLDTQDCSIVPKADILKGINIARA